MFITKFVLLLLAKMAATQGQPSQGSQATTQEQNPGIGVEIKNVDIPITPEIKAALLAANKELFGSFNSPKRAACRCRLEPLDLTPYKAQRYAPPTGHSKWAEFVQQAVGHLTPEQYDPATATVSWATLALFQEYLSTVQMPQLPLADIMRLATNVTSRRMGKAAAPCEPPSDNT